MSNELKTKNKITKATFKKFVEKHLDNKEKTLLIKCESSFNGMTDSVEQLEDSFTPAQKTDHCVDHTLAVRGVWIVNQSRDTYSYYEDATKYGISVYNACGSFTVAVMKD